MSIDAEFWFARRLAKHGIEGIFDGATSTESRREKCRTAIIAKDLQTVIAGKGKDGQPVNYADAFAKIFEVAL
jgi:hypothetical protein